MITKVLISLETTDSFGREIYKDLITGLLYCDVNLLPKYDENASIYYKGTKIEGEPEYPIENFEFILPKEKTPKQKNRGFEKVSTCTNAVLPRRATSKSAGYDFFSYESGRVAPGERKWFRTGIKAYMQTDEVLLCLPRSSLGFKHGLRLSNGTGVIDSDYYNNTDNEGEIQVSIQNLSDKEYYISKGNRLFQAIFVKYLTIDNDEPMAALREGGIGSTGKWVEQ